MLSTLYTLPNATTTLLAISDWSKPMFNEFLPIATLSIGFALGALVVSVIVEMVMNYLDREKD